MAHNTYEGDMTRIRDEEFDSANTKIRQRESKKGVQVMNKTNTRKRKRYHRHTQHQIQEMEAFFKECMHPDNKQRKELSRELGYVDKPVRNYPVISPPMPPRPVDLSVENFRGKLGIGVEIYEAGDLLRSIGVPTEAEKP
ncbi:HOMEOBOX-LEUCINE ZIPPER PROTEIN MERISTEM L1 [Salix purpurea]|uniref:HOMEOBOX-LEUCINE ZIPPER PROTEIN MERISTEM L1 n=1 Tax=Salix purpurea TaxID=77065 RepID=A0A9Q0VVQ1_SALPP|nr:HOMEOBOX-LEUCINE ZIPPER PROTEIN MERISTEM L1 [Salix purpurea]